MAQISKGKTFVTGEQVTASNLNKIVDDATLQPGAITEQAVVTTVPDTNLILTTPSTGASLNKVSLANVVSSLSLAKTNAAQSFTGNLTMSSGADIALTSGSILSLPAGAVQTLASGASQTLASGAILTLGQDPVADLQATTKRYVDNNFLKQIAGVVYTNPLAFNGFVSFNSQVALGEDTTVGVGKKLILPSDSPTSDYQAVSKSYVINTIAQKFAFSRTPSTGTFEQGGLQIADVAFKFGNVPAQGTTNERTVIFDISFANEILAAFVVPQIVSGAVAYASVVTGTGKTSKNQIVFQPSRDCAVYWLAIGR